MKSADHMLRRLSLLKSHLTSTHQLSSSSASLARDDPTEVLFERINGKGVITLNKVSAHNAINHNMTVRIYNQLKVWEREQPVSLIIIKGAGAKAFSAGGDVRELSETARRDHSSSDAFQFLRDEYRTQYAIGTCRVPYIALMDGYCMGGGCGLAVNGKFRVATERTVISMPETAIGFYPDNGGSYFLSHLAGELGTYLGLTCAQVRGEDAYNAGLATHYTRSGSLKRLEEELLSLEETTEDGILQVLDFYHQQSHSRAEFSLGPHLSTIDSVFSQDRLEDIIHELRGMYSCPWARSGLDAILRNSPTALKVTLRMLHRAKALDLFNCLSMELRLGRSILQNPDSDFFRGVKAVLVDKTGGAQWTPDNISCVTDEHVESHFISLSDVGFAKFSPS